MKKRKHHYVWRNYLRAWSDNDQIWCYREGNIFLSSLMNIGQERDFYRLNDLTDQEIESIKLLINQSQSELLRKLNHGWVDLFTAVFKIRETVNNLGGGDAEFEQEIEEKIINLGEDFHSQIESNAIEFLKGMLVNGTNFLNDDNNAVGFIHYLCVQYFRTKNIRLKVTREVAKLGYLDTDKAWNILSHIFSTNLGWSIYIERALWSTVILESPTNTSFLTGDQPIINTHAAHGNRVVEHDDLEFYYPLSPNKALLLTKNPEYQRVNCKVLSEAEVAQFNDAIVELASEQIYAASKLQLDQMVDKKKGLQQLGR